MKIWMYWTALKHPAIYLQNNEFNRIYFCLKTLINSKYVARYSKNIFCFMLITDSYTLTFFLYSKLKCIVVCIKVIRSMDHIFVLFALSDTFLWIPYISLNPHKLAFKWKA